MGPQQYETKTIVLKKRIDEEIAREIVDGKKTSLFRTHLRKPKKEEVLINSLKLYYESILTVSGKYVADFYRKSSHAISVDYNVREVILGDGVFPIKTKSGISKALAKKSKNKVDLKLDEHVFIKEEGEMAFDHHGMEINFPFKINSKTIENYPKKILQKNEPNVRHPELDYESAIAKISQKLKKTLEPNIRNLNDELIIKQVNEVYVPIFEAILNGPKKKVGILRIDAVRKKVL